MRRAVCLLSCVLLVAAAAPAADEAALAERILTAAGTTRGFCVDLRVGSGALTKALLAKSEFYVHGLAVDDARVAAARRVLAGTGLYAARTSVERAAWKRLPYPDYCANLVVCGDAPADAEALPWKEILRILRPGGGVAYIGRADGKLTAEALKAALAGAGVKGAEIVEKGGVWVRIVRPRPKGMGDWTDGGRGTPASNRYVEDDLARAPFQTLWIAGPRSFTKFGLPLLSNGRVLLRHGGITHTGRWKAPKQPDLVQAFDAYNGTLLWQRRLPERLGQGFVAVNDAVFAVAGLNLYALDAADGKIRWKLPPGKAADGMKDWAWYACRDGVLVAALHDALRDPAQRYDKRPRKALVGLSAADGKRLWKADSPAGSVVIGESTVFYVSPGKHFAAVEVATGKEKWRKPHGNARNLRYHRGRLFSDAGVFAADDGRKLSSFRARGILVGETVVGGDFKGMSIVEAHTGKRLPAPKIVRDPFCPKTGIPDGCSWMYGRCVVRTASTHCYFYNAGGAVIADLDRNEIFPTESFRGNCRTGMIAGGGLAYCSPSGCGCAFAVRGQAALVPVDEDFYRAKPEAQLEKGPAYSAAVKAAAAADDWPAWRHDAARSNVTGAKLSFPVKRRWAVKLPAAITPPVVAGGKAFVGSDDHSVYAVDAKTGKVAWRYITGGEIWAAPACWGGRVYAGSNDGWVYCLTANDGRLIWRFRGGPHERKTLFFGRPRSLWPIAGGVIAADGAVSFYAGYCTHDRVFVYTLDARTGKVLWANDKTGRAVEVTGTDGGVSPHGISPSGIIAASKDMLYVPQGMRMPAGFRRSDGKLMWWNTRGDSSVRSNLNVQNHGGSNLAVGGGLLFIGGPDRATGTNKKFIGVDAGSGRFWGADDPRLHPKAGRDAAGKLVNPGKASFGTYPITFGNGAAPVVFDGGIFVVGYRGGFKDLAKHLSTQFGQKPADVAKWSGRPPGGVPIVVADKVVFLGASRKLTVVGRADGKGVWSGGFVSEGAPRLDTLAAAGGRLYLATKANEIVCLAP